MSKRLGEKRPEVSRVTLTSADVLACNSYAGEGARGEENVPMVGVEWDPRYTRCATSL